MSATASAPSTIGFLAPRDLAEALEMKRDRPDAVAIAGGTDLMVAVNFDRLRPPAFLDVSRLAELRAWERTNGSMFLGSGVTYARIVAELASFTPLAQASRTVGSPQIRNLGTVGGNLGTASPAGDALPVLAAYDAEIEVASAARGRRALPWNEFLVGPKRSALEPDELILGARWRVTEGPGSFSKIGTRNAMVIAVANLCLVVDRSTRSVRLAFGSVGPTMIRAFEAEAAAAAAMEEAGTWDDPTAPVALSAFEAVAALVRDAVRPIDDVRGSAAYRRHGCGVMARRALAWALAEGRGEATG